MMGKVTGAGRSALGAASITAVLAFAPHAAVADEAAASQMRFRAIKVDVSRLAENGLAPEAAWMAQDLPARLQAVFAARMAPRDAAAPTLVVRIDQLQFGVSDGGMERFGSSAARDNIEGVGVVVAPNGRTIASYPLFTTQLDYTGGSAYEMGTERRRVGELAASFAQWLPGQMGL